eukprot:1121682-Pelagomonas_calceolata.AAC.6
MATAAAAVVALMSKIRRDTNSDFDARPVPRPPWPCLRLQRYSWRAHTHTYIHTQRAAAAMYECASPRKRVSSSAAPLVPPSKRHGCQLNRHKIASVLRQGARAFTRICNLNAGMHAFMLPVQEKLHAPSK